MEKNLALQFVRVNYEIYGYPVWSTYTGLPTINDDLKLLKYDDPMVEFCVEPYKLILTKKTGKFFIHR